MLHKTCQLECYYQKVFVASQKSYIIHQNNVSSHVNSASLLAKRLEIEFYCPNAVQFCLVHFSWSTETNGQMTLEMRSQFTARKPSQRANQKTPEREIYFGHRTRARSTRGNQDCGKHLRENGNRLQMALALVLLIYLPTYPPDILVLGTPYLRRAAFYTKCYYMVNSLWVISRHKTVLFSILHSVSNFLSQFNSL